MTVRTSSFNRRSFVAAGGAGALGLLGLRVSAHPGEGRRSATPGASPSASPAMSMMNTGTGAAYMHIANGGDIADRLISAATKVARIVEIHEMKLVDGVMKMSRLNDGLEIPAKGEAKLEPGGYHVMLIDLTQDLAPNTTFDLDLTFAMAGTKTVTVSVTNEEPTGGEPSTIGPLAISDVWARPAPMITAGTGMDRDATPEATPSH